MDNRPEPHNNPATTRPAHLGPVRPDDPVTATCPPHLEPVRPNDIAAFARCLRDEHVREIALATPLTPEDAVRLSLADSVEAYSYRPDGEAAPVFMMGVEAASPITGGAMVWMLGRTAVDRYPAGVVRAARWGIDRAYRLTGAAYLEQRIPAWYRVGVRFAARLGFTVHPADRTGWRRVVHERSGSSGPGGPDAPQFSRKEQS
ncbi:MAG: hypothetical protein LIQ30_09320 [Planctomycetes bacterium]|nr:hypothetical protein [Planctomycetota bacterium]MCD7896438.1 hypothetical protein [Planctomycetaceae bacterium]